MREAGKKDEKPKIEDFWKIISENLRKAGQESQRSINQLKFYDGSQGDYGTSGYYETIASGDWSSIKTCYIK